MGKIHNGQKIGILTAGGDCPGINAAIRGVGKTAIVRYDMKVIGISDGFTGLINKEFRELTESDLSGILTLGGTILGTSREKPFKSDGKGKNDMRKPVLIKEHYEQMDLDCLVCIGGNGTLKTAHLLAEEGLNVVGIPKTIDNDVWGTDLSFGFDSAVNIATEAIDRLHSTANSHKRIMIIELMGHNAGWIALYSGLAGGGDVILIPEIQYDEKKIAEYLINRFQENKAYSIMVVAEGIKTPVKDESAARYLSRRIAELTGIETRETVLGYIQRGGTPSPMDRVLATRYGSAAADLIAKRDFGKMVALKNNEITSVPLADVSGRLNLVNPDNTMVIKAKNMGTSFGN
ncbi:MAG TPA: 6-phosphofructokinase [Bacteroidales bacterium]|nr:6-phosphofructokinase [Bacteroidales bacterium]HBZ21547.1 6-phosphofructokinase [Bacteroidales bacterium]